jgi:hypothetical protein
MRPRSEEPEEVRCSEGLSEGGAVEPPFVMVKSGGDLSGGMGSVRGPAHRV